MRTKEAHGSATSVSWQQVNAFRLDRHHLVERAPSTELISVVGEMGGAQAQLLSAAQLSVGARVRDLGVEDLDGAIWKQRTLTKAWCMRRTLYLLPARDVAVFVRGSARRAEKEVRWALNHGVPSRVLEELLATLLEALERPLTQSELAASVARSLGLATRFQQGGGWGSRRLVPWLVVEKQAMPVGYLLHLAGARGVICSGPVRGTEATYVRADAWVPRWRDVSAGLAERELLHRYLRAFGPATAGDFAAWTSMRLIDAREIWSREESNLAPVDVAGWPAWLLRRDLSVLEGSRIERPTVRLLPYFDSFLLGHGDRRHLVESRHHRRVYRAQGWVAPVLLVNGRVAGVWSHVVKRGSLRVQVTPFGRIPRSISNQIREEGRELGRFLGCPGVDTTVA